MQKIMKILNTLFLARIPTLLVGAPGVGKTALVRAIARTCGFMLVEPTVRASEDICLPVRDGDSVRVIPVADFVRAAQNSRTIVFLDEITSVGQDVQAALQRFLVGGKVGDMIIPDTVWRVAACNPLELATNATELAPPLRSRFAILNIDPEPHVWAQGFLTYWGQAQNIARELGLNPERWAHTRSLVAAYVRRFPGDFISPTEKILSNPMSPFACPRTWDFLSRALVYADIEDIVEIGIITVGQDVGLRFAEFYANSSMPGAIEMLEDPSVFVEFFKKHAQGRPDLVLAALSAACSYAATEGEELKGWALIKSALTCGVYKDVVFTAARPLARAVMRAISENLLDTDSDIVQNALSIVKENKEFFQ